MPLGCSSRDQLDLPVVEAEARIDVMALRLDRAIVGQQDALRAAFNDGWRDRGAGNVGEALRCEQHCDVFLAQHL